MKRSFCSREGQIVGPWIGYVLAVGVAIVLVWTGLKQGNAPQLNLLIIVSGGLIGWIVGMLMTPITGAEQTHFPEYGKAISTFVGGYLAAKLDKLFDIGTKDSANLNELLIGRL
jgi:hypothetical protein